MKMPDIVKIHTKNCHNRRVSNHRPLLSAERRRRKTGIFRGIRWDFGCPLSVRNVRMEQEISKSFKDGLPTVTGVLQLVQVPPRLLCTVHCKNSSYIPIIHSDCERVSIRRCICKTWILSVNFATVSLRSYICSKGHIRRRITLH
jgi:hypothetical protein